MSSILIRGGTVVNADRAFYARRCADAGRPHRRRRRCAGGARRRHHHRRGRPVRDARRHRPAHPHAAALHGHGDDGRLLQRHGGRAGRRHDQHHRLRDSRAATIADGRLPDLARLGRKIRVRPRLSRRRHLVGRVGSARHGHAGAARRREQLQAFHGLQERHHVRRRNLDQQLQALHGTRRHAHRACRKRRTGVHAAKGSRRDGHHRPRRPPAVAPAHGRGRGGEPGMAIADVLNVPIYVVHVSCVEALEAISRARARGQRVYGEVLAGHLVVDQQRLSPPRLRHRRRACDEPALWPKGNQEVSQGAACNRATCRPPRPTTAPSAPSKRRRQGHFTKIPNGCGGIEERLAVIWSMPA